MILALMIVACILIFLAAINCPSGPVNFGWLGLFFWALTFVIGKI